MRTNLVRSVTTSVLCLALSVLSARPLAAAQVGASQYNHILFLRQVSDENDIPSRHAISLAEIGPEAVRLRDVLTASGLRLRFLHVSGGTIYAMRHVEGQWGEQLLAIDAATGRVRRLADNVGLNDQFGPLLYAVSSGGNRKIGRDFTVGVYDLDAGTHREITQVQGPSPMISEIAVSPDGRRLAWFDGGAAPLSMWRRNFTVLDLETKQLRSPAKPVQEAEPLELHGYSNTAGPPMVWVDARTLLAIGLGAPPPQTPAAAPGGHGSVAWVIAIDAETGEARNVAPVPGTAYGRLLLHRPAAGGDLLLADAERLRIDLKQGRLLAAPTRVGAFHLAEGGVADDGTQLATRIIYGGQIIANADRWAMPVQVSPDAQRIAWRATHGTGDGVRSSLSYFDASERRVRTIAQTGVREPFFWVRAEALRPRGPATLPAASSGWKRLEGEPLTLPDIGQRPHISEVLSLVLSSGKPRYRLHEPVDVTVTLTNKGDAPLTLKDPDPDADGLILAFEREGARSSDTYDDERPRDELAKVTLAPSESVRRELRLELGQAGQYRLRASYRDYDLRQWRGWLKSEPLTVSVEPSPDDDRLLNEKLDRLTTKLREQYRKAPGYFNFQSADKQLWNIGPAVVPRVVAMIEQEQTRHPTDPQFIARLGRILIAAPPDPRALPLYRQWLRQEDEHLPNLAPHGLRKLWQQGGASGDEALAALAERLASNDAKPHIRIDIAQRLSDLRTGDPKVAAALEAGAGVRDELVRTVTARALAKSQRLTLADWFDRVAQRPTPAGLIAARSIIRQLEERWHLNHGAFPPATPDAILNNPDTTEQARKVLRAWHAWAQENPIASERFFERPAFNEYLTTERR